VLLPGLPLGRRWRGQRWRGRPGRPAEWVV